MLDVYELQNVTVLVLTLLWLWNGRIHMLQDHDLILQVLYFILQDRDVMYQLCVRILQDRVIILQVLYFTVQECPLIFKKPDLDVVFLLMKENMIQR
jgi:hypothetical protein